MNVSRLLMHTHMRGFRTLTALPILISHDNEWGRLLEKWLAGEIGKRWIERKEGTR